MIIGDDILEGLDNQKKLLRIKRQLTKSLSKVDAQKLNLFFEKVQPKNSKSVRANDSDIKILSLIEQKK